MTVRERVLQARLIERVNKNPALAKQMGIEVEQREDTRTINKPEIRLRPTDNLK